MAYNPAWVKQIRARAPYYGLDPRALLAVAAAEGLGGGVGDAGTSFGPFQLHVGGALPSGRGRGWAESPAGIEYALRQIAAVAHGLKGRTAVEAIVRQFERPADPSEEIGRAWGTYGTFNGGAPAPAAAGAWPPAPPVIPGMPLSPQALAALNANLGSAPANFPQLRLGTVPAAAPPGKLPAPPIPTSAGRGNTPQPGKWVIPSPTMDRRGVATQPAVLNFVAKIAQQFGRPLTIGTGSNHNEFVKGTSRRSDHWYGEAADIPAAGADLTRLGQAALVAAGANPAWARQQKGGVFNIGGYNILFNTNVGGNHWNHLHVGLGRILGRHF